MRERKWTKTIWGKREGPNQDAKSAPVKEFVNIVPYRRFVVLNVAQISSMIDVDNSTI